MTNEPKPLEAEVLPTQAVAVRENAQPINLTPADIQTLVTVGAFPAGCPQDVIAFFCRVCAESRLSPFKRQIHIIKRWSKSGDRYTIQTGIDGYRAIANRTGQYAGNDDYLFDDGKTEFQLLGAKRGPTTATSTVYRVVGGIRCPFAATATWESYCPKEEKNAFMWNKMPFLMLGKCAEALALRKAFPEELAGLYTDEEMSQADAGKSTVTAPPAKAYVKTEPQGEFDSTHAGEAPPASRPAAAPQPAARSATARPAATGSEGQAPWKSVIIPKFIKKYAGMTMGEMADKDLAWWCENYDPKPWKGKILQADLDFKAALDAAWADLLDNGESNNDGGNVRPADDDSVPF